LRSSHVAFATVGGRQRKLRMSPTWVSSTDRNFLGCRRLRFGRTQDDACRWIYQVGLFARGADDGLISVGIHGCIVIPDHYALPATEG
jgi:hypothetical protein